MYQSIFKRYELKYMLTLEEKQKILEAMAPYMRLDQFGRSEIRNLYFDTDSYRLIRRSLEKPVYKEKLRVRSYRPAGPDDQIYVELKKKYKSVVYKRRLALPQQQAMDWLCGRIPAPENSQIAREIQYFLQYYETLRPTVFLSYEREAYYSLNGDDFRITFDDTIQSRQEDLSLQSPAGGNALLPEGRVLMEIKTSGGIPLWMTKALTQLRIYKTSFSKYGTAYQQFIYPQIKGAITHEPCQHPFQSLPGSF
ncbi:MAG: polyphosphate polymerase domain-containing protein [Clostridiales bacterium]|nr:polyphosphate polymerase domain-containing protein [Clostridiales bacterium]